MAKYETIASNRVVMVHDPTASDCKKAKQRLDPIAHCPRCCKRTDHRVFIADHKFHFLTVDRWGHRYEEYANAVPNGWVEWKDGDAWGFSYNPPQPVPHRCSPPLGFGEVGDKITCQTCSKIWEYLKPWGMYPGWQTTGYKKGFMQEMYERLKADGFFE